MLQVPPTMPPLYGACQPPPGPRFHGMAGNVPHASPSVQPTSVKRAPSAAILTGEAGANLVLSRLQAWGIPAQPAMPGLAYDLIADVPSLGLLRLQVKTKSQHKGRRCSFTLTQGFYYSQAGMFRYSVDDFDIAAFACLSLDQIFFCAAPVHHVSVETSWLRADTIARETFELALLTLQHRRNSAAANAYPEVVPPAPQSVATRSSSLPPFTFDQEYRHAG